MRIILTLLLPFACILSVAFLAAGPARAAGSAPIPTPTYDPFEIPVLPENPSQEELGASVYYYHCMPCHGDLGQGLTDAFRMVWEDEHQDCWGRGCHGGRSGDQGFPIPTVVPAVMASGDALPGYHTPQQLFDYLETTHPPQEPGRLGEEDTWALVALLWEGNGKPEVQPTILPGTPSPLPSITPRPASTTPTLTPTPESTGEAPFSVCGVSLFVPAIVVYTVVLARKSKKSNG